MKIVKVSGKELWSEGLNNFDHSLYLNTEFIDAVHVANGTPVYLDFKENDKIMAKLAGFKINARFSFQNRLYFYSDPACAMGTNGTTLKCCYSCLIKWAKKNNIYRIIKLSYDNHQLTRGVRKFKFAKRAEYIIDLTQDEETLNNNFAHNVICIKRRSINQGYLFKESADQEMTDHLINMLDETRKVRMSKGGEYYDYFYIPSFDRNSLEQLTENGLIRYYYVEKDQKKLTIMAVMVKNEQAYALFMGSTPEGYKAGAPTFLNHQLILLLKKRGYKYLNLGGVPIGKSHKGLEEFKQRLGAVKVWSHYGSTNFIKFPFTLLNPALFAARHIPDNKVLCYVKKKLKIQNY